MRRGIMLRVIGAVLLAGSICPFSGCFQEIDAPTCATLTDCPAGLGFASCESGRCFVSGRCDQAAPVPGDQCCPRTEGDRSADLDCLLNDLPTGLSGMATPARSDSGRVYITGLTLDDGGTSQVCLRGLNPEGHFLPPIVVGPGKLALAPVAEGDSAFVAYRDGVAQVNADTWIVGRRVVSAAPTGGLALVTDTVGSTLAVAWPTVAGDIVLFDTVSGNDFVLAGVAGPLIDATAFLPISNQSGNRVIFAWHSGALVALDPGARRVTATWDPPSPLVVPPAIADRTIVVAGEDGHLRGLAEEGGTLHETWSLDLGGCVIGGLVVDPADRVIALRRDGRLTVIDAGHGLVVGQGDFGTLMADLAPVLCPSGRLAAVTAGGGGIRTLLPVGDAGADFLMAMWFDTPSAIATGMRIAGDRMYLGTEAGRLAVWWFPEGPGPKGGSPAGYGDSANAADAATGGQR